VTVDDVLAGLKTNWPRSDLEKELSVQKKIAQKRCCFVYLGIGHEDSGSRYDHLVRHHEVEIRNWMCSHTENTTRIDRKKDNESIAVQFGMVGPIVPVPEFVEDSVELSTADSLSFVVSPLLMAEDRTIAEMKVDVSVGEHHTERLPKRLSASTYVGR